MPTAPFTISIPEEGWQKLLVFLDKEFPHCISCGDRFIAAATDNKLCTECRGQ